MTNILTNTNVNKTATRQLEIELLLACSRTNILPELKEKIQHIVRDRRLNWQGFIELASRHQVISLVYHNLAAICRDKIPVEYITMMRGIYVYNTQKNLFITQELIRICRLFRENNIYVIPFKGITLAMTAYKNLTFRDSCDIDLLISKKDVPLATELLLDSGYEMTGYIAAVENNLDLRYGSYLQSENNQKAYDFVHPTKSIALDLQWSLTEKAKSRYFNLSFEQLKNNAGEVLLADNKLAQFAPETMVLYLCFHGSKHCWQSLKWICDLAEFINSHPQLDWQQIELQARKLNLTTMLHLGLLLARNFYQTEVPERLALAIDKNKRAYSLYKQVSQRIFVRRFTQWEDYVFIFNITDSRLGKLKFINELLFTPTTKERDVIELPKSLFLLYYLIRPYRLTKELLTK